MLQENTPAGGGQCPEGAEGFGFGISLAKSKNSPLCGLRGRRGEISLAFIPLQPNLIFGLSFRRSKRQPNQQPICAFVSNLDSNVILFK